MARTKRKVNPVLSTPIPSVTQQRIYKVGGYIRLSIKDSGKLGADTIASQQELILRYIENQPDMSLCGLYCDNGQTGTNFNRPEFEHLMEDVRTGKIDCVVVKDLSRFGRNYIETGNYLERIFSSLNVRFVAVNDNFDTLTAEHSRDGYIVPLKNIINELYSKDIARKSKAALAVKQQKGQFIGSWAAYGYRKCQDDPHQIEPDPETAPVVKRIYQMRLEGMAYSKIARRLNEDGIPSPARYHFLQGDAKSERYANTPWYRQVVKHILSNEVYLGHMVQGRKCSGFCDGQKQHRLPKDEWVIVHNTHEPLIDMEDFHTVQQIAQERYSTYCKNLGRYNGLGESENILKGLVFCADCQRPLVRHKTVTSGGKNRYYVYICPTHADNPTSCPYKYLHETELKEVLWCTVQKELELAGQLKQLTQQYLHTNLVINRRNTLDNEIADTQEDLARSRKLLDGLFQNYVDKLITKQEYMELKCQYQSDMEQIQTHMKELEARKQAEQQKSTENPWVTTCEHFQSDTELTDEMAHMLIDRVEIDANNCISIRLRYRDEYHALLRLLASDETEGYS